jgi:hypothetical protein
MACRIADQTALDILLPHLDRIVQVSDDEVAQAMRDLHADTHNVAEEAGGGNHAKRQQCGQRDAGQGAERLLTSEPQARLFYQTSASSDIRVSEGRFARLLLATGFIDPEPTFRKSQKPCSVPVVPPRSSSCGTRCSPYL